MTTRSQLSGAVFALVLAAASVPAAADNGPVPSPSPSPSSLTISPNKVTMPYGGAVFVQVYGASGTFTAQGCNGIANASGSDGTMGIQGIGNGMCTLTVTDHSGAKAKVEVTVAGDDPG